jgi:dipeptidyl aminopeptidase/acylaminoacyl peptidase
MHARTGRPIRRLWRGTAQSIDWAPNGKRVVLTGMVRKPAYEGHADVYVVRADGTRPRRLISTPKASETDAVWSPDGRRIAFVRQVTTYATDEYSQYAEGIWTMRPDGTARRQMREPWTGDDADGLSPPQISWQPRPRR